MGSLASRPKVPMVSPAQYIYVPSPSTPSVPVAAAPMATPTSNLPGDDEVKAQARAQSLLERRRGHLGTVLTSFRGLLGDNLTGARKTLLGE